MYGRTKNIVDVVSIRLYHICLLLSLIILISHSMSMAAEYSLIVGSDASPVRMHSQNVVGSDIFKSAKRSRQVDLLKQITLAGSIADGDELVLDLFPGTSYHATVDRVSVDVQGSITIRGRLQNYPLGYALITSAGNISFVSIHVPELNMEYKIVYDPESQAHYVLEIDPLKKVKVKDGPAVIPPPPTPEEQREIEALQERIGSDQGAATTTIDVMVVYTPAAKLYADSHGTISLLVAQSMAQAQLVADNSLTDMNFKLVHSSEVDYKESGKTGTDLDRLQKIGDGYLDSVHTLRNTYGADLVVLFEKIENEDIAGLGFQLKSPSGEPAYGFSLTGIQYAGDYTNIHEIGHNMGADHHKQQNDSPGPGLFPYSAGWRWISTDNKAYCSVMTYGEGKYFADGVTHTEVGYFSNPSVTYIGTATGDAVNGDNARTIRETKNVVAAYRSSVSQTVLSVTPTTQSVGSVTGTATFSVSNTGTGTMLWTAAVTAGGDWLSITSGASGTDAGTIACVYAANTGGSSRTAGIRITASTGSPIDVTVTQAANTTACTATIDSNYSLHIPLISYLTPQSSTLSYSADFAYKNDPAFPALILFKLTNVAIQSEIFTCNASTLSSDFTIHIPDVLMPDGITRMWVYLAYSASLSTNGNVYFYVWNYGVISK
ncbi:MAG: M12 family metallo-peptidase [Deltaproteobacteria bacterium]